jgi:deoxyribodipyrimidine photo-lyase
LSALPLNHAVGVVGAKGGSVAAAGLLATFLRNGLPRYAETRAHPDEAVTSGLSPYLHFGHISPHQVVRGVLERESWTVARLSTKASGAREGWWGLTPDAEAFLDQVITWRELGGNGTRLERYTEFDTLPGWARATLTRHTADPRPFVYTLETFAAAETHDPLWNAAQRQLAQDGILHNYLRMLWGKKILEWTMTPQEALAVMIELNNRYALDGRDPNSYSGIFWVLGRYDRPWGPERPVFGTVRYMTSDSAARKLRLKGFLKRYGPGQLF